MSEPSKEATVCVKEIGNFLELDGWDRGEGNIVAAIIKTAQVIGKWCHVGRVNTPGRFEYFKDLGADSCDGTGLSRYSHMREKIYRNATEPTLL